MLRKEIKQEIIHSVQIIQSVQNIINYLGDPGASIECEDTGSFVDQLVPWMQSSNFKVDRAVYVMDSIKHKQDYPE
jgi:hypothetical protein